MPSLVSKAINFAVIAHGEQTRKYTGEPYWQHPMRVANWLTSVGAPWDGEKWDDEVIAAAWLHDVLEDTPVTSGQLKRAFGPKVLQLVEAVTSPSKLVDGSRAMRKKMDREYLTKAPPEAMSIKLADILDNTPSMLMYGGNFGKIYLAEMKLLVPLLSCGHWELYTRANQLINGEKNAA